MTQFIQSNSQWGVTSSSSLISYHPAEIDSKWIPVIELAKSCTGKITVDGAHLGCGILIGIDRVLVPSHVISNVHPYYLMVSFFVEDSTAYCCFPYEFKVLDIHPISDRFAILQLSRDRGNYYPGNKIPFPTISNEIHQGEFLFSTHSGDSPSTAVSRGSPCREIGSSVQFCSKVSTVKGDCGGGYFDLKGRLFGMHIARSSGMCTFPEETRQAIYSVSIARNSHLANRIFNATVCTPLCAPTRPPLPISSSSIFNPCFIEEGRKRAEKKFEYRGVVYYIQHDGHGDKHVLPANLKFTTQEKKQLVKNTQTGEAKFFPNQINHTNYDEYVSHCVQKWVEKGANQGFMNLEFKCPVGADMGQETKWIQIYLSGGKIGAHIRPIAEQFL